MNTNRIEYTLALLVSSMSMLWNTAVFGGHSPENGERRTSAAPDGARSELHGTCR